MKIALVLSTAFVTTKPDFHDHERRIQHYVNGFRQIAELSATHPAFDVFSVDNTVEDLSRLEGRLTAALDKIPTLKGKYYFWNNEMGRINKGSGLVAQWDQILPDLVDRYEYTVHYEPRQQLVNLSFFERMERQPDTYFCPYRDKVKLYGVAMTVQQFWTGLFSMRTTDLLGYVRAPDRRVPTTMEQYRKWRLYYALRSRILPWWLDSLHIAIETDFPRCVRRHKIPFVSLPALGVRWHEEATGQWVDMVDRLFE